MATLKPTSIPAKRLAATISGSSLSFQLNDILKWPDNTGAASSLAASDFGTLAYGAFTNPERTKLELFAFDPSTIASASITFTYRGLAISGDYDTEVSANKQTWLKGETVVLLGNDVPQLLAHYIDDVNDQTIGGKKTFTAVDANRPRLDSAPASLTSVNEALITRAELVATALASAVPATDTAAGYVEKATTAQGTAATNLGETGASLFMSPSQIAAQIQSASWITLTETASGDDAYTATTTPTVVPAAGMFFFGTFATANTTGATLSVNSETPVAIQKVVSGALGALETGDIIANVPNLYYRNASVYILLSPLGSMPSTAIMSEMATFFAATDETGSEAESLTGGITVPLVTLHAHRKTHLLATRVTDAVDGAVTYAHGLAAIPNKVKATVLQAASNGGNPFRVSIGTYDRVANTHVIIWADGTNTAEAATDKLINIDFSGAGNEAGVVTAIDATNVTITWTKTSSPTSVTVSILLEFEI